MDEFKKFCTLLKQFSVLLKVLNALSYNADHSDPEGKTIEKSELEDLISPNDVSFAIENGIVNYDPSTGKCKLTGLKAGNAAVDFSKKDQNAPKFQDYIKNFKSYNSYGDIYMSAQTGRKYGYRNASNNFLHWKNTHNNIKAEWKDNSIVKLYVAKGTSKEKLAEIEMSSVDNVLINTDVFSADDDKRLNKLKELNKNNSLIEGDEKELEELKAKKKTYNDYISVENKVKAFYWQFMKLSTGYYVELLRQCHNIVLTGAPGTGKTYFAKELAAKLITGDVYKTYKDYKQDEINEGLFEKDSRIGFVQFHPSYDYTDFVEGLRPEKDENEPLGFKRRNGVFKEFCKKAIQKEKDRNKSSNLFDSMFQNFCNAFARGEIDCITQKANKYLKIKSIDKKGKITVIISTKSSVTISKNSLLQIYNKYPTLKDIEQIKVNDLRQIIGGNTSVAWGIIHSIYKLWRPDSNSDLSDSTCSSGNVNENVKHQNDKENYVFIIDEINRGELSKIFGELFFSIDSGYRGDNNKIFTQYQNLIESDDEFYNGFYIPDNVYIIGTMNDIDRSVEPMDFAVRRRFTWIDIKPEDRMSMWNGDDKVEPEWAKVAEIKMNNLNSLIKAADTLGDAYCIGPSYFNNPPMDFESHVDWVQLWEIRIEPLLIEYLRGLPKEQVKEKIGYFRKAYYRLGDITDGGLITDYDKLIKKEPSISNGEGDDDEADEDE